MKSLKRKLAFLLTICIICSLIPLNTVFAAVMEVNVYVESFSNGSLSIRWDSLQATKSIVVRYHEPDAGDNGLSRIAVSSQTTNTYTITGLKDDYIYDISIEIYDDVDDPDDSIHGGGNLIGRGFLYYTPRITFYAEAINQSYEPIDGGGRESGTKPGLNIKWSMPKVYDHVGGKFEYAYQHLEAMQQAIRAVYSDNREIGALDFRVNISSDSQHSAVLISYDGGNYVANVSGNDEVKVDVRSIDSNGFMDFDLIGRKDTVTPLPSAGENRLPHPEVLPGTVYNMEIKPIFKDSAGTPVNAITAGQPDAQNGSPLSGIMPYTYTPIRFQLTRDNLNNIYVKIYKINSGSLDLPRLYYQVQVTDDPSVPGDWEIKKNMDDTYFNNDYAITVIPDMNPNNEWYYKIVVKSDGTGDRLESLKLPYMLSLDTSRPPLPMNVAVIDRTLVLAEDADGETILDEHGKAVKTTDIVVSWDKPANWEEIKANTDAMKDIVFHFQINISQQNLAIAQVPALEAEGKEYGHFPAVYRLMRYVSAHSPDIREFGNRLEYTFEGSNLFTGEYMVDVDVDSDLSDGDQHTDDFVDGHAVIASEDFFNGETDSSGKEYPRYLLPNKTYYLQMYTTTGANRATDDFNLMSDKSIIAGFTTLSGTERDVPLPKNFRLNENEADAVVDPDTGEILSISNYLELQWEKVDIDWVHYTSNPTGNNQIFYDLYMSTRTQADSFVLIGSTEQGLPGDGDVVFWGDDDVTSTYITALINTFDSSNPVYEAFGSKLRANTTYYFTVKTRLVLDKEPPEQKESIPTSVLPVTTVKGPIAPPDDSARVPIAPSDLAVALDERGNPLITGTGVVLEWSRQETEVTYELICTSERIPVDADSSLYENDTVYQSFIEEFGDKDEDGNDDTFTLDPQTDPMQQNFEFHVPKGMYNYSIDQWLTPNRLYYFSLRAKLGSNTSVWVSIPVTTMLIEAPFALEAVNDSQLGFFWQDSDAKTRAEDCRVYIKGPQDSGYKQLTRAQSTVVKEGINYFGRAINLKPYTPYSIRVTKVTTVNNVLSETTVFEKNNMYTKDDYNQIEIKWRGKKGYKYQIAVKTEDDADYTILSDSDLLEYVDYEGHILPYYTEKTSQTAGTDYSVFYARIKTALASMPGGGYAHQPLKSNTKYYIKVRAIKIDPVDTAVVSYSKYAGPVNTRTEFSQDDYDRSDQEEKSKANFLDKINKLEEGFFWRLAINNGGSNRILLKGDRVINAMHNSTQNSFEIDISGLSPNIDNDIIYIPVSVIKAMKSEDRNLILKVPGGEFTLRPETIDIGYSEELAWVSDYNGVSDVFLKIAITRSDKVGSGFPDFEHASRVNDLEIKAQGYFRDYGQLKNLFNNRLYDADTGLVSQKLNILLSSTYGSTSIDSDVMNQYIDSLISLIEKELSSYADYVVESSRINGAAKAIESFQTPMLVKLLENGGKGLKTVYTQFDGSKSWEKVARAGQDTAVWISFDAFNTGKFVILTAQSSFADVPANYWARNYIDRFTSRYDLAGVFVENGQVFSPEERVTGKELVLLYEMVMQKAGENTGLDIKQKMKRLGLDKILNPNYNLRNVTKQETAAVAVKIYALKLGMDAGSLRPSRSIFISDERSIDEECYKQVVLAIDMDLLSLDADGRFSPIAAVTRAEVVAILVKTLEKTGEM